MVTELGALKQSLLLSSASASEPLSAVWQVLAILALVGIVAVVLLAIIEPGPLVRRRPFSRKQKTSRQTSIDARPAQQGPDPMTGGDGGQADNSERGH